MSTQSLFDAVQAYLQAHHYLQDCQSRGACDCASEQRVQEARHHLEKTAAAHATTANGDFAPAAPDVSAEPSRRRTVIVAIKDLDTDAPAIDTAATYAQALGAQVLLLTVIEPSYESSVETGCPALDMLVYWRINAAEMLAQAQLRLPVRVRSETRVREGGSAAAVVLEEAEECNAELIVLGERGGGRWAHFLSPGTAMAVIRAARCPVLTVNRHVSDRSHELATTRAAMSVVE